MTATPRIVAVTAHRPQEVAAPLSHVEDAKTVEIDDGAGFLARNVTVVRKTHEAICSFDPDVVLVDSRELLSLLAVLVASLHGVPVVYRFKGDNWATLREGHRPSKGDGYLSFLEYVASLAINEITYALASGYIAVSEQLQRVVTDRTGCTPSEVEVVPVSIQRDRLQNATNEQLVRNDSPEDRFPALTEETVILTVTNLKYRAKLEGVKTSIEGVSTVLREREDIAYVIAGDGPYYEDLVEFLDRRVTDSSVRERIYTPGFVENVGTLYEHADLLLYLSHLDGYPNAVLEGQLAGLPVVANNSFGMAEQITHGETGILLDSETPDAVSEAVTDVLDTPDERDRIAKNAQRRVVTENTPAVVGEQLKTALGDILDAG